MAVLRRLRYSTGKWQSDHRSGALSGTAVRKSRLDSPVGTIVSGWKYEGDQVSYEFTIPSNVTAEVILPDGRRETLSAGTYKM